MIRRHFLKSLLAMAISGAFVAPHPTYAQRRDGRRRRLGRGRDPNKSGAECRDLSAIHVTLEVDGVVVWRKSPDEIMAMPNATTFDGGHRRRETAIPLETLIPAGTPSHRVILQSCVGAEYGVDNRRLEMRPRTFLLTKARRGFIKVVHVRDDTPPRTELRDIRRIVVQSKAIESPSPREAPRTPGR